MPKKITSRLARAAAKQRFVRVHRSIEGADTLDGFVLATSPAWTLLSTASDLRNDGFSAIRTTDITRVGRRDNDLTVRVLRQRGHWPPAHPPLDLTDLPGLLRDAAAHHPLLCLHLERQNPDACWVGTPVEFRPKSFRVREIDPRAHWIEMPVKYRYKDISRIDFGGHYEKTLAEFAQP
ncbi:hypothetical protein [Streptomyces sp. NPDC050738]|uniref:hypothetical protein n=1 Tax=Streptomyces sp. NPDC050738 TaxID=3154744 RepID=UPI003424ECF2